MGDGRKIEAVVSFWGRRITTIHSARLGRMRTKVHKKPAYIYKWEISLKSNILYTLHTHDLPPLALTLLCNRISIKSVYSS